MRHSININGKTLSYLDEGEGFPILFGHSFLWSAEMWRPQIDFFKAHYRCIVPDLWGHGQSGTIDNNTYTIQQLAEDYHAFMQALGVDEYAVVGLSVGGMWGTQLALSYPQHVKALVVMDSYVGPEPQEALQHYSQLLNQLEADGYFSAQMIENVVPFFFSENTFRHNQPLVQGFKNDLTDVTQNKIATIATLGRGIFNRCSLLDELSTLSMPMSVIVGEYDLPRPQAEAQQMAERLGIQANIIKDAGHISNFEQIEHANDVLGAFFVRAGLAEVAAA